MSQSYGVKMDYFVNLIWADGSPSWSAAKSILLPFLNKLSFDSKTYWLFLKFAVEKECTLLKSSSLRQMYQEKIVSLHFN